MILAWASPFNNMDLHYFHILLIITYLWIWGDDIKQAEQRT